ncbi:hypothetical protein RND81_02G248700 [Saponaria officinalis]|uniref:DUF7733 domain-containing protein n=1 Tax=Saponaria officinalis TaxID=3572 RepID=A0AAW1MNY4_SAPOF
MSGISLAVAPGSEPVETTKRPSRLQYKPFSTSTGVIGSLRVIELQLVAFIMVFSVSGLVPLLDLIFPAFASAYIIALSQFAFPVHANIKTTVNTELFQGGRLFRLYVILGTTVGLFLPLAYVLGGFARGDDHAVRSATPHLFLLSFQILTENIISGLSLFSPPVRALVPLIYTVRRIFVILDWMQDFWVNKTLPSNADAKDVAWYWFGRNLAAANMLYFSTILFCFLIPRLLPRAFERYLNERDEIHMKMSEDISVASQRTTDKKTD